MAVKGRTKPHQSVVLTLQVWSWGHQKAGGIQQVQARTTLWGLFLIFLIILFLLLFTLLFYYDWAKRETPGARQGQGGKQQEKYLAQRGEVSRTKSGGENSPNNRIQ